MPPPQPWGQPQGLPPNAGMTGYGGSGNHQFMPSRPHNFYPPPERPPFEKQPHHGISMHGHNEPPIGVHSVANQQSSAGFSHVSYVWIYFSVEGSI